MVGVNAKNKAILDEKFICPTCSLIIRDPVRLTACGHRLCQTCIDTCYKTTIECPECLIETPRKHVMVIDRGFQADLQLLPIECFLCNWIGHLNIYQNHLDHSHQNLRCQYCGQDFNSVNNLNEHQILKCQERTVDCALKDFGCDKHVIYCNMSEHYSSEEHRNSLGQFSSRIHVQIGYEKKLPVRTGTDPSHSTNVAAVDLDAILFRELCETLGIQFDDRKILENNGPQYLNNILLLCQKKCPTLKPQFFRTKVSVEEKQLTPEILHHQNDASLEEEEEEVEDLQFVPHDGTLVWKIGNVTKKMDDAQSERQTSIYSPPFYSSPTGYKMRARLHLYGDGNARRTHMSLFFVLMRSEHDTILKFPFNYKVTFCLYDQTPIKRHIIDSFRPDVQSNSFQRPQSNTNILGGIPKFFPLPMIRQKGNPYVRDDTMFIKIMVDFGDIPKTLLPYAISLNPGLPIHIRQAMIRQAIERTVQKRNQTDQREEEKQ